MHFFFNNYSSIFKVYINFKLKLKLFLHGITLFTIASITENIYLEDMCMKRNKIIKFCNKELINHETKQSTNQVL